MYSIATVCRLAGINASTLRSWERRYGLFAGGRDAHERRRYSPEQALQVSRLARLVARGHAIGSLVQLADDELDGLEGIDRQVESVAAGRPYLTRLVDAVANWKVDVVRETLGHTLAFLPPIVAVSEVLSPFLAHVGAAWVAGHIPVHLEHLVVAMTREAILISGGLQARSSRSGRMIFATMPGEHHEMGLLLGWRLALSEGWDALMLGPELPVADIAEAARIYDAQVVTLSIVHRGKAESTIAAVSQLRALLPEKIALWFGAPAEHPVHAIASAPGLIGFTEYRAYQRQLLALQPWALRGA
jgi:DNA-binding transcriptional MerR regulator/methylmalonyl-CoA mutase cobalamin-binding subunit